MPTLKAPKTRFSAPVPSTCAAVCSQAHTKLILLQTSRVCRARNRLWAAVQRKMQVRETILPSTRKIRIAPPSNWTQVKKFVPRANLASTRASVSVIWGEIKSLSTRWGPSKAETKCFCCPVKLWRPMALPLCKRPQDRLSKKTY